MQRFNSALIHGMAPSAALITVSARTHSVAALAGVLPLINAAVNWSNVRQILDCIVEAAASTLGQIHTLQRCDVGGSSPSLQGSPGRRTGVREGDAQLLAALAGLLQMCFRALGRVVATSGALVLPADAAAATGASTVARYLALRTPLLATLHTALDLPPWGDALRVSALLLLDFLVSAGEASSLAQHAGILNSLQQALCAEELKARAAAVIAHLCQHPGAVEFVGVLASSGLFAALTTALANLRQPDDVLVETYATLQHVYDFGFISDVAQCLGQYACVAFCLGRINVSVVRTSPVCRRLYRSRSSGAGCRSVEGGEHP